MFCSSSQVSGAVGLEAVDDGTREQLSEPRRRLTDVRADVENYWKSNIPQRDCDVAAAVVTGHTGWQTSNFKSSLPRKTLGCTLDRYTRIR